MRWRSSAWSAPLRVGFAGLLVLVVGGGVGCETGVDFVDAETPATFAISGFLDTAADTQFVRIERLRTVLAEPDRRLRGTLTTTGPSGLPKVWRDSTLTLPDGSLVTLAFLPERAEPGTHTATIRDEDGSVATGTARVPLRPGFEPTPIVLDLLPEIDPNGDTTGFFAAVADLTVFLNGLDAPPHYAEARYYIRVVDSMLVPAEYPRGEFPVIYTNDVQRRTDGRYAVTVRLRRNFFTVRNRFSRPDGPAILLDSVVLSTEQRGPAYDDQRPRNLANALGFFGGVGRYAFSLEVGADTLRLVGFEVERAGDG